MEIYKKQSLSEAFSVYFEKRMARILLLGIISGFPWVLIGSSLSLWLKEEGLSRSTIGWAGLIFGVYAFNYLWAPLVDRIRIPWLTNKIGHRRGWIVIMQLVILISLVCWMLSLGIAIIATEFDQIWLIYVTGVIGGFNIGGIFAVDRVFMTRLSPEKHLGEFYGLYSTVGRFATILGPLLWGFVVNTLGLGRNPAMGVLIILLIISFVIIRGVSDNQEMY